jgi:hypothetical protein
MDRRLALGLAALALVGSIPTQTGLALAQSAPPPREVFVAIKDAAPFAMKSETGAWTGISIELWNRLAEKLNPRTTFREFQTVPRCFPRFPTEQRMRPLRRSASPRSEKAVDFHPALLCLRPGRENYSIATPLGSPLRLELDVAMLEEMRQPWWREGPQRYLSAD